MKPLTDGQRLDWLGANIDNPKRLSRYCGPGMKIFAEIANDDDEPLATGSTLRDALDELINADKDFDVNAHSARAQQDANFRAGMRMVLEVKVRDADALRASAQWLVDRAAALGLVLTVEQFPLVPLAMGHHETVVSVRPARSPA